MQKGELEVLSVKHPGHVRFAKAYRRVVKFYKLMLDVEFGAVQARCFGDECCSQCNSLFLRVLVAVYPLCPNSILTYTY